MFAVFRAIFVVLVGIALGLWATYLSVESGLGFDKISAGPWVAYPKSGTPDADPYVRANISRSGQIPLGVAEGISLIAQTDSAGGELLANCAYVVRGLVPQARFWTIGVVTPKGQLMENAAHRYGFTSEEILWDDRDHFEIQVSSTARSKNWLAMPQSGRFAVMMRLYETSLSTNRKSITEQSMPMIDKVSCR